MPRIARKNTNSNFYHIIVQGINKEYVFNKHEFIEKYKKIILNKKEKSNVTILAYCIMNNHAHFLIFSEKIEYLSKFMQRVNTSYSQYYNKIHKRVGYVFRDRFYSEDILNTKHLYRCIKYIHNNPVKAKICNFMHQYKYSSYNEFLDKKTIINEDSIKILFGNSKDYKKDFYLIHNLEEKDDIIFRDIKDKEIKDFIKENEKKYNKSINELKKDKKILIKLVKDARKETAVTLTELAKMLDLSKSTIHNYSKKNK